MASSRMSDVMDNVDRGFAAVFGAARSGNEMTSRLYRFSIDEAERTQRENTDLMRQWLDAPTDVMGFSRSMVETWRLRGRRRAGLARTVLNELSGGAEDSRHAMLEVVRSGRASANAGIEAAREAASDAGDELRDRAHDLVERAEEETRNGRSARRKSSRR
jgi:hypothetical protein